MAEKPAPGERVPPSSAVSAYSNKATSSGEIHALGGRSLEVTILRQ